jgi:hypothetical protein
MGAGPAAPGCTGAFMAIPDSLIMIVAKINIQHLFIRKL